MQEETKKMVRAITWGKDGHTITPPQPCYAPIQQFISVDEWTPAPEDMHFNHVSGALILNAVSEIYGITEPSHPINNFILLKKRSYNSGRNPKNGELGFREICTNYLNYFTKFYDTEKELIMIYARIKLFLDYHTNDINEEWFKYNIKMYILYNPSIIDKVKAMNNDNYIIRELSYKNKNNPSLEYNDFHASVLMEMSLYMKITIPLITHYLQKKNVLNTKKFILSIFDEIFEMKKSIVDVYAKFYETANTNIQSNKNGGNQVLWDKQNIRGNNITTQSTEIVDDIILQLMPKYVYNRNIISLNFTSIKKNIGFKITDIAYEFNFKPLSSSKRDEDNNSEFDKYEAHLTKQDEALYIQNKVNCEETMKSIESKYGPFNEDEIRFVMRELQKDGKNLINNFQKDLIFNLMYNEFGDTISIKSINTEDYIKLMLAAKRKLQACGMKLLPYIISSRILRFSNKKSVNKKELSKLQASPSYPNIINKYKNDKIEKLIMTIIAQIISSEFQIISFNNPDEHGIIIDNTMSEIICEEVLVFIQMI